jgi:hypothetical protein
MQGYWDLIGIGVVGFIGLIVTVLTRRRPVSPTVVPGPSPLQVHAEEKAVAEVRRAEEVRDRAVEDETKKRAAAVNDQVDTLRERRDKLLESPEDLNAHLLDVGKQVRGGRPRS